MTEREELQRVIVAKLREHADFLKHNVATWQLLARAADEIERLRADLATFGNDTVATENRIIDAEFKAQELRTALLPCVGWLEYAYSNVDSVTAAAVKAHLPSVRAALVNG